MRKLSRRTLFQMVAGASAFALVGTGPVQPLPVKTLKTTTNDIEAMTTAELRTFVITLLIEFFEDEFGEWHEVKVI